MKKTEQIDEKKFIITVESAEPAKGSTRIVVLKLVGSFSQCASQ